jgi:P4 family phage/plasmid primase-like protien
VDNKTMVKLEDLPAHSTKQTKTNNILINAKNGVLHIDTDNFSIVRKPHDRFYYFTGRLEIEFNPIAECPTWDLFLSQVVEDDVDKKLILLYLAYCLLSHDYKWESALYIYGEGANGKGTLAKSFKEMFSKPTFTAISSLEKNFGLMGLIGGNFWWANESDNKYINTEDLKRIISGEPVEIDIKHNKPETHQFKMKVMITANEIPLLKKYADKRRFIVVRFPNKFEGNNKDVELDNKLRNELPGLLNLLMEQIPVYLQNSANLSANISDRYEVQYEELSDPFKIFVETYVTETKDYNDFATTLHLTMAFNAWAIKNNHETHNTTTIGRRISSLFKSIRRATQYVDRIHDVVYTSSLEGEQEIEKSRQRGYEGLKVDWDEIYKINPQWNVESVNYFHQRQKNTETVFVGERRVTRVEFSHKIHALSENGISWEQAIELGKLDNYTQNEVIQILQTLITEKKVIDNEGSLTLNHE